MPFTSFCTQHSLNCSILTRNRQTEAASSVLEEIIRRLHSLDHEGSDASPAIRRHKKDNLGSCELCTRQMPLTSYHLIPRSEHQRLHRQSQPPSALHKMRTRFAWICRPYHSVIHKLVDCRAMADKSNTLEKLEGLKRVQLWVKYASVFKEPSVGYEGWVWAQ